jgi:pimeloyl-ACP methyl ester carboxylesterase
MEGFSRGGLYAFNYAVAFPERVAAVYLDGPILDIRTMRGHAERTDSGKDEWRNCLAAYGLTEKTVNDFKGNPADRAEPLAKAGIPILLIAGDADTIVPFAENAGALAKRYRDLGGPMLVIVRKGQDHHPHSLANPTPIVDFLVKNARF